MGDSGGTNVLDGKFTLVFSAGAAAGEGVANGAAENHRNKLKAGNHFIRAINQNIVNLRSAGRGPLIREGCMPIVNPRSRIFQYPNQVYCVEK